MTTAIHLLVDTLSPVKVAPTGPISVTGTANKNSTATTVTLNCAAGGDWSVTPGAGDLMLVFVYYSDDSTAFSGSPADFTNPAGWTVLTGSITSDTAADGAGNILRRGILYRFASASEATYTWTAQAGAQSSQGFILEGICLHNAGNPAAFDPAVSAGNRLADTLTQGTGSLVVGAAGTALVASWGQLWSAAPQQYASVSNVNGVTPTSVKNIVTVTPAGTNFAALSAVWLAPGAGTWTPSATRAATAAGQWGWMGLGIHQ